MSGDDIYAYTIVNCHAPELLLPELVWRQIRTNPMFANATSFNSTVNGSLEATATSPSYLMFEGARCPCIKNITGKAWLLRDCTNISTKALYDLKNIKVCAFEVMQENLSKSYNEAIARCNLLSDRKIERERERRRREKYSLFVEKIENSSRKPNPQ